jgi:hypothetical protein
MMDSLRGRAPRTEKKCVKDDGLMARSEPEMKKSLEVDRAGPIWVAESYALPSSRAGAPNTTPPLGFDAGLR